MTAARSMGASRTLPPDLVRDILAGVARDRPELLRDPALPAPRESVRSTAVMFDLDSLVADLLHGIQHADRPALIEHARAVARAQLWIRDFDHAAAAAIRNGEGDFLAIADRLLRMKERESGIYARGMLILEMARDHCVPVRATIVRHPRRSSRSRG